MVIFIIVSCWSGNRLGTWLFPYFSGKEIIETPTELVYTMCLFFKFSSGGFTKKLRKV